MQKIKLEIIALAQSETHPSSFVVLLKEESGERRLPVVIGSFEAQAIAVAAEGIKPNRPLTHDLFFNALRAFDIGLEEVVISELRDGIFYATLMCISPDGTTLPIDSRTSDAMALAIRSGCPIYTYPTIMDAAGVVFSAANEEEGTVGEIIPTIRGLQSLEESELQERLEEALAQEDYEEAARIRDEMARRSNN